RNGVGDVVELEVEKYVEATLDHPAHGVRSRGDEQLLADLQPAGVGIKVFSEPERTHRIGEVERDDDARAWGGAHGRNLARVGAKKSITCSRRASRCAWANTFPIS